MYESYLSHREEFGGKNTMIDRIDNNGNYCKGNTRWVKADKQARNKRKYKNNKSGITGVSHLKTKYGDYWTARISHPKIGKEICKLFSIEKLGYDEAFKLACDYREYLVNFANEEFDAGYSDSHGL